MVFDASRTASQQWMAPSPDSRGDSSKGAAPPASLRAKLPPSAPQPGVASKLLRANDAMARLAEWQGARIDTGLRYQVGYNVKMGRIGLFAWDSDESVTFSPLGEW